GDHIVVGVRRENNDALRKRLSAFGTVGIVCIGFSTRPAGDGMLKVVEDLNVDLVGGTVLGDDIAHAMLHVIVVGEFEYRLVYLLTQPHNRLAYKRFRPVDALQQPRCLHTGELRSCRLIKHHQAVGMLLQERRRYLIGDLSFKRLLDDAGLALTPGHHDHLFRFEDAAYPHRDRLVRYVLFTEEIAGRVDARHLVEGNQSRERPFRRSWLVETDVPRTAYPQHLDVDPAEAGDLLFIVAAESGNTVLRQCAVGDVYLFFGYVDMVEQVLAHEPDVTLQRVRLHRIVFVKVESINVFEAKALVVHLHQLGVYPRGSRSGSEAKYTRLTR